MKKLMKYMKGYGKECILGPLFKLLEATFELFIPLLVASIVDVGIGNGDMGYILNMCLVMIGLGIVGLASSLTAQYFAAGAAVGFAARLRHAVMKHILGLSYAQIDSLGTSAMVTRMTADINQVQNGVWMTAIYHPSALLRDLTKRPETFDDLLSLREKIKETGAKI